MSLLTSIQEACRRIAIPVPTAIVSSTDPQVLQLWSVANEEVQTCATRFPWQKLRVFQEFATLAQEAQTGALPTGFDSLEDYICNETMWDRTTVRKVFGPLSPEQWENEKAFPVYTPIAPAYMIQDNILYLTPTPSAGDTLAFMTMTTKAVRSAASAIQFAFEADDDTSVFGDMLLTKGVIWRFKQKKGIDYAEEFSDYETLVNTMFARDGGKARLSLNYGLNRRILYPANLPIGSWPS